VFRKVDAVTGICIPFWRSLLSSFDFNRKTEALLKCFITEYEPNFIDNNNNIFFADISNNAR